MTTQPPSDAHRDYARAACYRLKGASTGAPPFPLVVVMLHGLGGNRDQLWRYAAADPSTVRLAPDLRGHGDTELVGSASDFTFDGLTADLLALLDQLEIGASVVVGVSMGAGVAVDLALREPRRVTSLMLIRPAWGDIPSPENLTALRQVGSLLARYGSDEGQRRYRRSSGYQAIAEQSPAAARSMLSQFADPSAQQRSVRLTQMPMSVPFHEYAALAGIAVPTMVIGAPQDPLHPLSLARQWAAAIPGAEFRTVPARDDDRRGYDDQLCSLTREFIEAQRRRMIVR